MAEAVGTKTGEGPPPQEISIPEVFETKIFPIIDRYGKLLREDVKILARDSDYQLGEISQKDVERNLGNLETLKKLLKEFIENPSGFRIAWRSEQHEDGNSYRLKLKGPSDPKRLPIGPKKAVTQLSLELDLGISLEKREEIMRSAGLGRSPEKALTRLGVEAPKEISLVLSTNKVYRDEELGRINVNFQSGVEISSSSQEGLRSRGVVYCGATRHKTDYLKEKALSRHECEALREYVLGIFERK